MGKISSANPQQQPSLVWVVPIACAFWIGIIVTGWVHRDLPRGRTMESLNFTLEILLAPALMLLIMWLAFSPTTWRHKAKLLLLLSVSWLPVAFLSFAHPGQSPWSGRQFIESLFFRVYFRELFSLSLLQLGLVSAVAVLCLRALNHYLSCIEFSRVPVEPRSMGKKFGERLRDAYWSTAPSQQIQSLGHFPREEWVALGTLAAALLVVDGWDYVSGRSLVFHSSFSTAAVVTLIGFLLAWAASQFYWRWWSCGCLALGLGILSLLPLFTRVAVAIEAGFQYVETVVQVSAVLASVLLLTATLALLTLTHQMPRRRKRCGVPVKNPPENLAQTTQDHLSSGRELPKQRKPMGSWAGFGFGLLWLLFCGLAYWLPLNIDPLAMAASESSHLNNGWLSAQLLKVNHGERRIKRRPSDRVLDSYGWPKQNFSGQEYLSELFNSDPRVSITVQQLAPEWDRCLEALQQRALALEDCHVSVLEPITDFDRLRQLLDSGVTVGGVLDVQGGAVPEDLLSNNLFYFQLLLSADLDLDTWENVLAVRPSWYWAFENCRLPDQLPNNLGNRTVLADCEISPQLFADIAAKQGPLQIIELYEIAAPELFAAESLIRFLAKRGVIAGRPPLKPLVPEDFPRVFAPNVREDVESNWSRWSVAARWLLLDPDTLQQVIARRLSLSGKVTFNADGDVVGLEVLPLRDCPSDPPWNPFPHVEELRVDLTPWEFDQRKNPLDVGTPEVIGYQPGAFPKLSRVKLRSVPSLNPRLHPFLEELLAQPQVAEIEVQLSCPKEVWEMLVKVGQAKRLRVDTVPVRGPLASDSTLVDWVEYLRDMPGLEEIVIVDNRNISMIDYMNALQGRPQASELTDAEKAEIEELRRKDLENYQLEWTRRIQAVAPHLKKITVLDEWPLDQELDQD